MSRRRLAVLPFAAAAATVLLAPVASAAGPGCAPKASKTVVANEVARVSTTGGGRRLFGCLRSSKTPLLIVDQSPDDPYVSRTYGRVALSGHFVGWYGTSTDASCKADCPPGYDATREFVSVTDLRTRRSRFVDAIATALAVSPEGSLAWVQAAGEQTELRLSKSGKANALVDSGEITEISFQNAYLLWRNGGQATWTKGQGSP